MNDKEVILAAMQRERDELHDKIMQVDRIIKRIKNVDYSNEISGDNTKQLETTIASKEPVKPVSISTSTDVKVQILRIFEILGKASKLSQIQNEFTKLTGSRYKIRDVVRGLQQSKILQMLKLIDSHRGILWVKKDWVRNGQLMDEYKPEGFDLFYQASNVIYE
ncbi:MAG: hypothetical protein HZB42_07110 [Sphingobacteriales bacterium]|nr:hypothetical protein [Sphingobacteriales bacterium]